MQRTLDGAAFGVGLAILAIFLFLGDYFHLLKVALIAIAETR